MTRLNSKLFAVLFAFLLVGWMQPAQSQLGIAGGLNFESADDIDLPTQDATLGNSRGYHLGVIYDLDMGMVSIRPGFFYRDVGTYNFGIENMEDNQFDVTAYEVPVDLRVDVLSTSSVRPYLLAGPMLRFPQGEGDFDAATEDITFSLNLGVGLSFGDETSPVRLQPEVRYEVLGTQFIQESFEIGGQEFQPEGRPSFNSLSLRLNLLF